MPSRKNEGYDFMVKVYDNNGYVFVKFGKSEWDIPYSQLGNYISWFKEIVSGLTGIKAEIEERDKINK